MTAVQDAIFKLTGEDTLSGIFKKNTEQLQILDKTAKNFGISFDKTMFNNINQTNKARDAVDQYNDKVEAATKQITGGLTPAMQGIDTSKLEKMGTDMDTTKSKTDNLTKGLDLFKLAAGAAFTGAGLYLQNWVQQVVTASVTVQKSWLQIGAAMGMTSTQTIAMQPQLEKEYMGIVEKTGQSEESLKAVTPTLAMYEKGNAQAAIGDLPTVSALAWGRYGGDMTQASNVYGKVVSGASPMALKQLGINLNDYGISSTQFSKEDESTRKKQIDSILQQTGVLQQNAAMADSDTGKINEFNSKLEEFKAKLGNSLMPTLMWLMSLAEKGMDFVNSVPGLNTVLGLLLAGGAALTLLAGPLLALSAIGPVWGSISGGVGSLKNKLFGLKPAIEDACSADCGSSSSSSSSRSKSKSKSKGKTSKSKGKFGRLSGIFSEEKGTFSGGMNLGNLFSKGGNVAGEAEEAGGLLSKVGGLGRFAGLAGLGLDAIPGIGEIMMAGTAIAGGIGGWQSTKGNWGDKGKGAVGGAVEALTMGLIPKDATVNGLNWMYDQFKQVGPKVGGFFQKIPGDIWNAISGLPGTMMKWGGDILNAFIQGLENTVPGIGPILKIIADHLPQSPPKIGPLAGIKPENMHNWASNISDAGLRGFNKLSDGIGSSLPSSGGSGVHHHHHYGPITIDATHLSADELMSKMIFLNETVTKPEGIPNTPSGGT